MIRTAETSREKALVRARARRITAVLSALAAAAALTGCGLSNRESVSNLAVDENGRLTCTVMEPAEAGDTEESIRSFVQGRIDEFSGTAVSSQTASSEDASDAGDDSGAASASDSKEESGQDSSDPGIQIERCEIRDNKIELALSYHDWSQYAAFNGTDCFFGTVAQAEEAGYSLDGPLLDDNEAEADYATIAERSREWKVVILEEPMNVRVPDKILYASENMKITGRLTAAYNGEKEPDKETEEAGKETEESGTQEEDAGGGMAFGDAEASSGSQDTSQESDAGGSGRPAENVENGVPEKVSEFAVDDFEQIIIVFK